MLEYKLEINGKEEGLEGVKGYVVLRVPSAKERLNMMKESNLTGADSVGLEQVIELMDKLSGYVKEVNVSKGDVECKDLETLGYYDFGTAVTNKVSAIIMGGIPTGKR